ncbi:Hachiman antiphage defense system protein HamA [Arenimonas oryziterrae]|uniref:Hachiman antiphage defense system protein HamA n=1 Tax=Arenimonas oryziterrae TaxID=498055 RepID=UPI0009DB7B02|nr:Hachiman antiphage defense system protein HamA [Arenimonas oryziterrae]
MATPPGHIKWLGLTTAKIASSDGLPVDTWELSYVDADEAAWSEWAAHFRRHYCDDALIDRMKAGTPFESSRRDYLVNLVFPDKSSRLGPAVRSGDFAEILVSDLLEHHLAYWVPRTRFAAKQVRDESAKGVDVIGIRQMDESVSSPNDELATAEVKAQMSGKKAKPRLQDAVKASERDEFRKAETLNAVKQRFIETGENELAAKISRFQDPLGNPYVDVTIAAAVFCGSVFDATSIGATTDCATHRNRPGLKLLVVHAKDLMKIANKIYARAADEA